MVGNNYGCYGQRNILGLRIVGHEQQQDEKVRGVLAW
jgi:hypothetical protein